MQSTSLLEQVKVMWSSMETRATCNQIQDTSGELSNSNRVKGTRIQQDKVLDTAQNEYNSNRIEEISGVVTDTAGYSRRRL